MGLNANYGKKNINGPWIILKDFKYCRFHSENFGGYFIPNNKFLDINFMIFDIGIHKLAFVGFAYTLFNNRTNYPIHI